VVVTGCDAVDVLKGQYPVVAGPQTVGKKLHIDSLINQRRKGANWMQAYRGARAAASG